MSAAIVHFVAGSGSTLLAITVLYRLEIIDLLPERHILAFAAGIWGLGPDIHHVISHHRISEQIYQAHNHPVSDVFFLHYTLDRPEIRAVNHEMIGVSVVYFGIVITITYLFGVRHREGRHSRDN